MDRHGFEIISFEFLVVLTLWAIYFEGGYGWGPLVNAYYEPNA